MSGALLHPDLSLSEAPRLIHELPGRVRLHAPGWSERTQRLLTPRLLQRPGVRHVQGNPLTGNILVLFDLSVTDALSILAALRTLLREIAVSLPTAHRGQTAGIMRLLNDVNGVVGIGVCVVNLLFSGSIFGLIVNGLELLRVCSEALVRHPKTLEVAGLTGYSNGYVIVARGVAWIVV